MFRAVPLTTQGGVFLDLERACQSLLHRGSAERVVDDAIRVKPLPDAEEGFAEVNKEYAEDFNKRYAAHKAKEREAEKRLRDFVITY